MRPLLVAIALALAFFLFRPMPALSGIVYPPGASPAAIAVHKAVLADILAHPPSRKDKRNVFCPGMASTTALGSYGKNRIGRDPDPQVRLSLKRECFSGGGGEGGGE